MASQEEPKQRPDDETEQPQDGFIGTQVDSSDARDEPNQGGFAEQGRGAPEGSEPGGVEGDGGERTANLESDIEGSNGSG